MLARVLKRPATASSVVDVDELARLEFRDRQGRLDMHPSVYELDGPQQAVRAYAEHAAACDIRPDKSASLVDVAQIWQGEVRVTPGSPHFRFIRERHRELVPNDEEELLGLVRALMPFLPSKMLVTREQWTSYVKGLVRAGDDEWCTLCRSRGDASFWRIQRWTDGS